MLAGLSGDVLEIGGGTGANLPCFGLAITSLTLTEAQSPILLRRLERTAREHRPSATVLRAGRGPSVDDHTFEVAVSTLVLCGVDDQPRAWRELRVLRPDGQLPFI